MRTAPGSEAGPRVLRVPHSDLTAQYLAIRAEIDAAMTAVLHSGRFILGENVRAFEAEFAAWCGSAHGVGVGSGTEALHLAFDSLGVGPGDQILTVPNAAVFPLSAIRAVGAEPVLVDVDPSTCCLDPDRLETFLRQHFETRTRAQSRLKAIAVVHLYGHPADMDPILSLAHRYDLRVVEDVAQAHGARYKGRRVGTLGDAGCFSFYPTKNLGAFGDGGPVASDDAGLAERLRRLRNYGEVSREATADRSRFVSRGTNSRLDELQAAVLRVKLRHLDSWTKRRREIAARYDTLLRDAPGTTPLPVAPWAEHVYHLYVVRSRQRDALRAHLEAWGVETLVHYPVPAHLQPAYAYLGQPLGSFPVCEMLAGEILSLPVNPELSDEQVEHTAQAVWEFEARPVQR